MTEVFAESGVFIPVVVVVNKNVDRQAGKRLVSDHPNVLELDVAQVFDAVAEVNGMWYAAAVVKTANGVVRRYLHPDGRWYSSAWIDGEYRGFFPDQSAINRCLVAAAMAAHSS